MLLGYKCTYSYFVRKHSCAYLILYFLSLCNTRFLMKNLLLIIFFERKNKKTFTRLLAACWVPVAVILWGKGECSGLVERKVVKGI